MAKKTTDKNILGTASFGNNKKPIDKQPKCKSTPMNSPKADIDAIPVAKKVPEFADCFLTMDKSGQCKNVKAMMKKGKKEISDFVCNLVCDIYDLINAGKIDVSPARVGLTTTTSAIVWDRRKLFEILAAHGYCDTCANLFIDSLEEIVDDDIPSNIMICSEADVVRARAEYDFSKRHK